MKELSGDNSLARVSILYNNNCAITSRVRYRSIIVGGFLKTEVDERYCVTWSPKRFFSLEKRYLIISVTLEKSACKV